MAVEQAALDVLGGVKFVQVEELDGGFVVRVVVEGSLGYFVVFC